MIWLLPKYEVCATVDIGFCGWIYLMLLFFICVLTWNCDQRIKAMLLLGVRNDEGVPTVHIKQLTSKKVQPCIGRFCALLCTDLVLGGSWNRELSSGVRVECVCVCVGFQLVCLDKGKCCDTCFLFRLPGSCFPTISKNFLCLTHSSQTFSLTLAFLCYIVFSFISTYFLELSI